MAYACVGTSQQHGLPLEIVTVGNVQFPMPSGESGHKKARGGGRGQDHFKKWRERKTEIDYKPRSPRPIRLLQLLTKLGIP